MTAGHRLVVEHLSLRFGGIVALDDVSFTVETGEQFGVIGPNGAGKTSLLNCLSGINRTRSGTVRINDLLLTGRRPHTMVELGVGRSFQGADYLGEMTVMDFVLLGRLHEQRRSMFATALGTPAVRRSEADERDRVLDLLAEVGLDDLAESRMRNVSYGVRKLADVLRALAGEPRLLLLDEPTSGTTSEDRRILRELLRANAERGVTVVVVDHDVQFIVDCCTRLLALSFGETLATGTPAEVLANPEVIESYMGESDMSTRSGADS